LLTDLVIYPQFLICRYIHDKAFEIYSFINSRKLTADQAEAFKQFHDVIYYLNIKQSTFVIHGTGSIQSDLRLQYALKTIKKLRGAYDRFSKINRDRLEGQSNRRQESIKHTSKFRATERLRQSVEKQIRNKSLRRRKRFANTNRTKRKY